MREFNRSEAYKNRTGKIGVARKLIPAHGTVTRYNSRVAPCRCDLCVGANRLKSKISMRAYRDKGHIKNIVPRNGEWDIDYGITREALMKLRDTA